MTSRFTVAAFCFCLTALALGSALTAPNTSPSLQERAKALWNARVAGDWATEYHFLSVEETGSTTKEAFVSQREEKGPLRFLAAEVGEVAVTNDIGWVEVKYAVRPQAYASLPPQNMQVWDLWYLRDGQWYPMTKEQRLQVPKLPPHRRPAEEEVLLSSRAQEFWKAREGQDKTLLYQFLKPEYRARVPVEQFLSSKVPVSYLSHRLEWAEVIGEHGRVKVVFTYQRNDPKLADSGPKESITIEDWIKTEGQWYRHKL